MKFRSTRGDNTVTLDQALIQGIADDGGLYLPDELPAFTVDEFSGAQSIADVAKILLLPFFGDSALLPALDEIIAETFSFPLPVKALPVAEGRMPSCLLSSFQSILLMMNMKIGCPYPDKH